MMGVVVRLTRILALCRGDLLLQCAGGFHQVCTSRSLMAADYSQRLTTILQADISACRLSNRVTLSLQGASGFPATWTAPPAKMTDQENNNSISANPFAALFGSIAEARQFVAGQKEQLRQQTDDAAESPDDSDNSVSESLDDCDDSVAEINRSFLSQQEICEQLNINHMIQRIFLITLDNSDPSLKSGNGIPLRCVYLEELGSELDGQDWLDMNNVEQVGHTTATQWERG
ncbi:hypothetical protein GDO78_013733 [Eleutherodactylus coqui]|uniref:Uncharacterized protein n=1 Tax=Eleutherodactylus coqui TaxID=57060 RepID=A0A8J6E7C3_ELECQ|nr:hypothetical protein GDO78_013733 [Eleutherodactylus coqui]